MYFLFEENECFLLARYLVKYWTGPDNKITTDIVNIVLIYRKDHQLTINWDTGVGNTVIVLNKWMGV